MFNNMQQNVWCKGELMVLKINEWLVRFYIFSKLIFDGDNGVEQPKCEASKLCTNQAKMALRWD